MVVNGVPTVTQWDVPPPPATPPRAMTDIELRVGKRLLWVGGAACPLRNIARVYAVFRFLPAPGSPSP